MGSCHLHEPHARFGDQAAAIYVDMLNRAAQAQAGKAGVGHVATVHHDKAMQPRQ